MPGRQSIVVKPGSHSRLGPSSAHRWTVCPRSVTLGADSVSVTSKAAAEGTAAHEIASLCLERDVDPQVYLDFEVNVEDFKFIVDQEWVDYIRNYVCHVWNQMSKVNQAFVEHNFSLSQIHEDLGGTADSVVWQPEHKHLHVTDLKFGKGVVVEVKDNTQLKIYGLGAIFEIGILNDDEWRKNLLTIWIVQPRAYHPDGIIRSVTYTWGEIMTWAYGFLKPMAKRCDDPKLPCVPGSHCRFCNAIGACSAQKAYLSAVIKTDFCEGTLLLPDKATLSPQELDRILDVSTELRDFLNGAEAYAQTMVEKGKMTLPLRKLVRRGTKRKWIDAEAASKSLKKLIGDKAFKTTLVTPAQADKLVKGQKLKVAKVKDLWEKPIGGLLLALRDDNRPEVISDSAMDFLDSHELLQ